jgi:N-acetylglucosamine-6-phosphate deacetylase
MILLSGARVVTTDRILEPATLVVDGDHIVEIDEGGRYASDRDARDLHGRTLVPGFIDVHVHGVEGHDTLDRSAPIGAIARRLTKYGVTAFCPTTVACDPHALRAVLRAIRQIDPSGSRDSARVLPAHLESNFINPEFRGAQPLSCLRRPPSFQSSPAVATGSGDAAEEFTAEDILAVIDEWRAQVGIVTLAPELEGALPFVRQLVDRGHRVSLGHSGASYETGEAGIDAGARHATHLFNRMPPLLHREPGLVGAVLARQEIAAEIICDGFHVHPAVAHAAIATKGAGRVMAITDGTALSGLPPGSQGTLGGRRITARETAAFLDDGTVAGSVLTMDRAFKRLVETMGASLIDAARMCATTPADELGLTSQGRLAPGMLADFAVLDANLRLMETWVGGQTVYSVT